MTENNNTMYKFLRDGKEELVEAELWQWQAFYDDGTSLEQFDKDGFFHQFKEIDQSKLIYFKMFSLQYSQAYVIPFTSSRMKLIHFYRKTGLEVGTPNFREIKFYCFGYESQGVKHLLVITPTGEAIMCEDVNIISIESN